VAYNGLLRTPNGGDIVDTWLKNWIDEWDSGYEQMIVEREQVQGKKKIWKFLFFRKEVKA
tara:strand:+ start:3597 stop:3776 length:180 start_codon:yes stop_codon:yes gene_type:complete